MDHSYSLPQPDHTRSLDLLKYSSIDKNSVGFMKRPEMGMDVDGMEMEMGMMMGMVMGDCGWGWGWWMGMELDLEMDTFLVWDFICISFGGK